MVYRKTNKRKLVKKEGGRLGDFFKRLLRGRESTTLPNDFAYQQQESATFPNESAYQQPELELEPESTIEDSTDSKIISDIKTVLESPEQVSSCVNCSSDLMKELSEKSKFTSRVKEALNTERYTKHNKEYSIIGKLFFDMVLSRFVNQANSLSFLILSNHSDYIFTKDDIDLFFSSFFNLKSDEQKQKFVEYYNKLNMTGCQSFKQQANAYIIKNITRFSYDTLGKFHDHLMFTNYKDRINSSRQNYGGKKTLNKNKDTKKSYRKRRTHRKQK